MKHLIFNNFKNLNNLKFKIGKNNFISKHAVIHDNVTIGNNNKIHEGVIIYPNTIIGDNNNIFPRNVLGEFPVTSDDKYNNYKYKTKGLIIGNNNLFHVNNIIFSGIDNNTFIGNNNKFLAEIHIGHDVQIFDNVTFYARSIAAGYSIYLNYSNIGMFASINQKIVVGQYSMIGANNTITKHVFPYYININNKIHRLNEKKIPNNVKLYDNVLKEINMNLINKDLNLSKYNIPKDINNTLLEYTKYLDKGSLKISKKDTFEWGDNGECYIDKIEK